MSAPERVQADIATRARELLAVMHRAADTAAQYITERSVHRDTLEWRSKAHQDYVSDGDTGAERNASSRHRIAQRLMWVIPNRKTPS